MCDSRERIEPFFVFPLLVLLVGALTLSSSNLNKAKNEKRKKRSDKLPYSILNLFSVLTCKKAAEDFLRSSGLPLTILRPGRLIDGPYTSYDLNTLLKATTDESRKGVRAAPGDSLDGQTSRLAVAEAVVQSLALSCLEGKELCLETTEGEGPGQSKEKWEALLCK